MVGSDLIKFESWIKCADSAVPLIGRKCTHTQCSVVHIKAKKKKQGGLVLRRPLIVSYLHSCEFRGFLIRGFSVAMSLKLGM